MTPSNSINNSTIHYPQEEDEAWINAYGTQTVQVMMVEDDKQYFTFVRHLLLRCETPRFQVAGAVSLEEAIHKLSWEAPDIILLDLTLPDSEGLATLVRLREHVGDVPVVVLTGSSDMAIGLQAVALGAHDYLVKHEIGNDSLIRSVRYAIERRKSEEATLRWAAIRDFTSMLAHDLKVPLIGANTVFEALISGQFGELQPQQAKAIADLHRSNEGQLRLVRKLLDVYRFEANAQDLKFHQVEMATLIMRCVEDTSFRADFKDKIQVDLDENLPTVLGDEEALSRLISNLLDNAISYSCDKEQITIKAKAADSKLVIHVHNRGSVIPAEVQSQLFQSFWTGIPGKSYVAKTGLGLYFCNRIVNLHHGTISCRSTHEEGTTIRVILPAALKRASA